ncbi:hypothetical protein M0811_03108 [Anaeramoeba ignava]|uniref:Uncharacterized protein n=1 Tax=Anaeramoeba ignava TaxID=1746090 RepID=A0A9Q0R5H7_ANAIG|nr:hypothetical protein M0811_03108 [Anaeramoeba ignava]
MENDKEEKKTKSQAEPSLPEEERKVGNTETTEKSKPKADRNEDQEKIEFEADLLDKAFKPIKKANVILFDNQLTIQFEDEKHTSNFEEVKIAINPKKPTALRLSIENEVYFLSFSKESQVIAIRERLQVSQTPKEMENPEIEEHNGNKNDSFFSSESAAKKYPVTVFNETTNDTEKGEAVLSKLAFQLKFGETIFPNLMKNNVSFKPENDPKKIRLFFTEQKKGFCSIKKKNDLVLEFLSEHACSDFQETFRNRNFEREYSFTVDLLNEKYEKISQAKLVLLSRVIKIVIDDTTTQTSIVSVKATSKGRIIRLQISDSKIYYFSFSDAKSQNQFFRLFKDAYQALKLKQKEADKISTESKFYAQMVNKSKQNLGKVDISLSSLHFLINSENQNDPPENLFKKNLTVKEHPNDKTILIVLTAKQKKNIWDCSTSLSTYIKFETEEIRDNFKFKLTKCLEEFEKREKLLGETKQEQTTIQEQKYETPKTNDTNQEQKQDEQKHDDQKHDDQKHDEQIKVFQVDLMDQNTTMIEKTQLEIHEDELIVKTSYSSYSSKKTPIIGFKIHPTHDDLLMIQFSGTSRFIYKFSDPSLRAEFIELYKSKFSEDIEKKNN